LLFKPGCFPGEAAGGDRNWRVRRAVAVEPLEERLRRKLVKRDLPVTVPVELFEPLLDRLLGHDPPDEHRA
jgi:hypothetical protein